VSVVTLWQVSDDHERIKPDFWPTPNGLAAMGLIGGPGNLAPVVSSKEG